MARRTQQAQVYAAERLVADKGLVRTLDQVQVWVDSWRDFDWWKELAPRVYRIEVAPGAPGSKASQASWWEESGAGLIELHQTNEHVVLHEAAHCIANSNRPNAGHGPEWVRTFLLLTFHLRGTDAWATLRQAFLDKGVVIDPREDVA